jgi:hypothetical protein
LTVAHPEIRSAIEAYEQAKTRRWEAWTATDDAPARAAAVEADAQAGRAART